jgi:hypothetical protein
MSLEQYRGYIKGLGHQGRQPRLKSSDSKMTWVVPFPVRGLQRLTDIPLAGQRQAPGGDRRSRDIPAQPLDLVTLLSAGRHPGV